MDLKDIALLMVTKKKEIKDAKDKHKSHDDIISLIGEYNSLQDEFQKIHDNDDYHGFYDPYERLKEFQSKYKIMTYNITKLFGSLCFIIMINIIGNYMCHLYNCNYWSMIFHHDIICNTCIDFSKIVKDHHMTIYFAIGSCIINEIRKVCTY